MPAKDHVGWRPLFLRRVNAVCPLPDEASRCLDELTAISRTVSPDMDIADEVGMMAIVASGAAYRYRLLADGRRAVFDLSLPGDLVDLEPPAPRSGLVVAASTELQLALLHKRHIRRLSQSSAALEKAIGLLAQAANLRLMVHVLRLARLSAYERVSHFLLELYDRLDQVGLATDARFQLPLNQIVMADALGMTKFHVNRTLRRLRADGWIELDQQTIQLHDTAALAELCEYERWDPVAASAW